MCRTFGSKSTIKVAKFNIPSVKLHSKTSSGLEEAKAMEIWFQHKRKVVYMFKATQVYMNHHGLHISNRSSYIQMCQLISLFDLVCDLCDLRYDVYSCTSYMTPIPATSVDTPPYLLTKPESFSIKERSISCCVGTYLVDNLIKDWLVYKHASFFFSVIKTPYPI